MTISTDYQLTISDDIADHLTIAPDFERIGHIRIESFYHGESVAIITIPMDLAKALAEGIKKVIELNRPPLIGWELGVGQDNAKMAIPQASPFPNAARYPV